LLLRRHLLLLLRRHLLLLLRLRICRMHSSLLLGVCGLWGPSRPRRTSGSGRSVCRRRRRGSACWGRRVLSRASSCSCRRRRRLLWWPGGRARRWWRRRGRRGLLWDCSRRARVRGGRRRHGGRHRRPRERGARNSIVVIDHNRRKAALLPGFNPTEAGLEGECRLQDGGLLRLVVDLRQGGPRRGHLAGLGGDQSPSPARLLLFPSLGYCPATCNKRGDRNLVACGVSFHIVTLLLLLGFSIICYLLGRG
jgi:hypothetical protein